MICEGDIMFASQMTFECDATSLATCKCNVMSPEIYECDLMSLVTCKGDVMSLVT